MLQWFRRTYPSYNLQPLLLKRQRELEEAQAFNAWLGERRLAQEGQRRRTRSGRSCATVKMKTLRAHGFSQRPRFEQVVGYLERNEPLPLDQPDRKATTFVTSHFYLDDFVQSSEGPNPQPLQHTPLRAIPEEGFRTPAEATDEDLARMRQGGGNRFGEDDLAKNPEADALTNNGQGPPSITGRLRSAADGAQAAADLVGAGAAGLAAVQASGTWGAWQKEQHSSHPRRRGCWSDAVRGSWRSGNGRVGRGTRRRRSLRPGPRNGLGAGEHALPASAGQRGAVQDVRSANNMNDATQPQHFTLRSGSSTSDSPASSRASSESRRRPITRRAPSPGA